MYVEARELRSLVGRTVEMRGWIASKRASGKVAFLNLRDGSGFAQLVCERGVLPELEFEALKGAGIETPALAAGTVVLPEGRDCPELRATSIRLLPSEGSFPIGRKEHGPDFLMISATFGCARRGRPPTSASAPRSSSPARNSCTARASTASTLR